MIIDQRMNEILEKHTSKEEIKNAIFMMNKDKAARSNGFTIVFYQQNWDIVGEDVTEAMMEFFKKGSLLKS